MTGKKKEQEVPGQATGAAAESAAGRDAPATEAEVDSELLDMQFALKEAQKELEDTERELVEHKDAMLRMQAEMENLRKRLIRDLEKSRKRALEDMMGDLLPVLDSLERGLEAAAEAASVESLREGKALIKRMLAKTMQDHGLVEIDPFEEVFNPELHEAMSMLPSPEHPANTVMEVVQKGYRLHDRLIRPARVVVSRGPEQD